MTINVHRIKFVIKDKKKKILNYIYITIINFIVK